MVFYGVYFQARDNTHKHESNHFKLFENLNVRKTPTRLNMDVTKSRVEPKSLNQLTIASNK